LIDFPSVFTGQIGEPSLSATLEDHIIKDIVEDELWNSGATGGFKTSDERGLFTQAGVNISHAVDNDSILLNELEILRDFGYSNGDWGVHVICTEGGGGPLIQRHKVTMVDSMKSIRHETMSTSSDYPATGVDAMGHTNSNSFRDNDNTDNCNMARVLRFSHNENSSTHYLQSRTTNDSGGLTKMMGETLSSVVDYVGGGGVERCPPVTLEDVALYTSTENGTLTLNLIPF